MLWAAPGTPSWASQRPNQFAPRKHRLLIAWRTSNELCQCAETSWMQLPFRLAYRFTPHAPSQSPCAS
jgi:hypothetical protein